MIAFRIDGEPPSATHHAKRLFVAHGRAMMADTPELVKARKWYATAILPYRPESPLAGPIRLSLRFVWPYRASESRSVIAAGLDVAKTSRPDCSNLAKTIEDQLARLGFFADDAQVTELFVSKAWGPRPGVEVRVEEISLATAKQTTLLETA